MSGDQNPVRGKAQVFGFDRCRIWIDQPDCDGLTEELGPFCANVVHKPHLMPWNARWKSSIDLHQPSSNAFPALNEILGTSISAMPTSVEVAWDVISDDQLDAENIAAWRLAHVYVPYSRYPVTVCEGTSYFSPRSHIECKKRGGVLVEYHDKPCKLAGSYGGAFCSHMEFRITGKQAMKVAGILSIDDLYFFNHGAFWNRIIRLYELPKTMRLGRLLYGPKHAEFTDSAISKRARKFVADCSPSGKFIMQNAILENPGLRRHLEQIPLAEVS